MTAWRDLPEPWLALLLIGGAVVALAGLAEGWVRQHWLRLPHDWAAHRASLADAGLRALVVPLATWLGVELSGPVLRWVHSHRLQDLSAEHLGGFFGLLLGVDLLYYAYHRCAHRCGWLWATHCVHHSSNALNLAAALRLGWTARITGHAVFFAPLVWLGYPPEWVIGAVGLNLLYQAGLHLSWQPRLGPLEWVFNTPRHHRVHHAANPAYHDCNFGGVLIVFDRLFGSFRAERPEEPVRIGLDPPLHSHHPLVIGLHGWQGLWRAWRAAPGWRQRLRVLWGPPGV